jgi:2-methylcitrate dehydratase PrpD
MSKQLHPGKAAMNGLLAALLAQRGFTGARRILEGEKGFFRATSQDFDEEKCLTGLGEDFFFERNSIKYYASCGHTHSAIDAVLQATKSRPMNAEEIEEVKVSLYQAALDLLGNVKPVTPYIAKFCIPFCVATALAHGHVNLGDFSDVKLNDPETLGIMERVSIQSDPELSQSYPLKWPARVEIVTRDGQRLEGENDYPKGDPENPLDERRVIEKFMYLTEGRVPTVIAGRIVERVMNLEDVVDVTDLLN